MNLGASWESVETPGTIVPPDLDAAQASSDSFREERKELQRVLNHPEFSRSANLVRFLSYICNKYFDGRADEIREHSIAVEALGRRESSFDSHVDPIVRVTARSLRKKLGELYNTEWKDHPLQIVLPLGHYVPEFLRRDDAGHLTDAASLDTDENESAASTAPSSTERAPDLAAVRARVLGILRSPLLKMAIGIAATAGVFLAGYFWGAHTERIKPQATQSFQWGAPAWSDEFNGAAQQLPNPANWTYDIGSKDAFGHQGWGNQELETYCSPSSANLPDCNPHRPNAFLDGNGHLVLRAIRNPDGKWTSARITTRGLREFQYGRIEARMKLPVGTGLWPAFWMLGSDYLTTGWPASGSVTIVENVGLRQRTNGLGNSVIRSTLHGPRYFGGNGLWHDFKLPDGGRIDDGNFHTYGIIWSPGMIQFYVDDPANVYFVQDSSDLPEGGKWVFDHPFFLVMDLAVGGEWPGDPNATTPSPEDLVVDYVRVYKIPKVSAPAIQWQPLEVYDGSSAASIVTLHARKYSGRVRLSCSVEPAAAACSLGSSVVDLSNTLAQEDSLTISTSIFTDQGRVVAPPGRYKLTITATTISGDHSQLSEPFEVKAE